MLIRRIIFVATVVMLSVNLAVGYRIYRRDAAAGNTRETLRDLGIMMQAMQKIRTEYVDADKLEPKQLVTDAMNGLFTSLDPHSTYLPKEEMEWLEREEQGEFSGFGFVYNVQPDGLHITEVKPDSPALRAGLKPEDVLISCNGKSLEGLDGMAAMQALHGKEGEKADLRIRRGGPQGEILDFAIIRATFNVASVEDFGVIGDTGIAMIRIEQFTVPSAEEFEKILRRHVSRKMKGLIIDLRANPGGLIFSAVQITSMFLDSGVSVVTQEGPREVQRYDALSGYKCPADIPVAILVDDASASASELMAQCLKDYKRAVIVGRRTYGKGSVQTVHYFGDGSGIKLTVAKYFTPSRTPIHGQGVEPDVISVLEEETEKGANRPRYRKDALDQDVYVRDAVRILQNSNSKEEKQ